MSDDPQQQQQYQSPTEGNEAPVNLADAHTEQPSLQGRRAVVTGGTTGIGRAIAVLLASEGAKVFVCGRDENHLADAIERLGEVGQGSGISVDFASYLMTTQQAVKRMGAGSDIVLIGSMSAVSQGPGSSIYVAAKSGIEGFAPSLRKELAEKDIKVGLVEPGFTGADFQYPDFPPEKQRELIHQHKMLRAEDIAVAVQFMLRQPRRCAVSHMRVETRLNHP